MLSRVWDTTIPLDTELAGDGDDEIRDLKVELKEHLEQDHQMGGVRDPLQGDCEGYHKKLTLYPLSTDPTVVVGAGIVYTKIIDSVIELFFMDDAGTINQLTENGVIKLNTLANNINANGHTISNAVISNAVILNAVISGDIFVHDFADTVILDSGLCLLTSGIVSSNMILTVKRPCMIKHYVTGRNNGSSSTSDYVTVTQEISPINIQQTIPYLDGGAASIKKYGGSTSYTEQYSQYTALLIPGNYILKRTVTQVGGSSNYMWKLLLKSAFFYSGTTVSDVITISQA